MGHPYFDIVDNSTDFESKILWVIELVCRRINRVGIETINRLKSLSRKRKFLVVKVPAIEVFPKYQDFEVEYHYLLSESEHTQCRIRRRGQKGKMHGQVPIAVISHDWCMAMYRGEIAFMNSLNLGHFTYTHTERRVVNEETVELMMQLSEREYQVCSSCVCE